MGWSVTVAGRTYTQANVEGNAYADESSGLPAILRSVAEMGATISGLYVTSTTATFAEVGRISLSTHQHADDVFLPVGTMVRAASASDLSVFVVGKVISFSGRELVIDATVASAGGVAADWVIGHPFSVIRSIQLDPAPILSADLNANGNAILNATNLQSYAATLGAAYALSL